MTTEQSHDKSQTPGNETTSKTQGDNNGGDAAPESPDSEAKPGAARAKTATKPGRILIGSQRDHADPQLKVRDRPAGSREETLRHAHLLPEQVDTVIKKSATESAVDADPIKAVVPPAVGDDSGVLADPTVQSPLAQSTTTASGPTIDPNKEFSVEPSSLDDEIEAALSDVSMESLLDANEPGQELEIDTRCKATVTRIHNDNVFVSLKGRYEGVVSLRQFKKPPHEGAMLDVMVTSHNEEDGLYEVAIPGAAVSVDDWSDLTEGSIVDARITGSNTGGLECSVNNIRGFIPASQIDVVRVENLGDYANQKLQCVVSEVNERRKKLVLSRRAILERERQENKQKLLEEIAVGDTREGLVTKLMDFGAFVDVGGVEGLVHVSKMSWDRVEHPKEVLKEGDKIKVRVEKVNAATGKISLSYRDLQENPWSNIDQKYPVGEVVSGVVSRLAQFGAFVKLEAGVEGLVHISELAHHRVLAVKNVVNQGDEVQVKILSVDPSAQKIGLSLKATLPKPEAKKSGKNTEEPDEFTRESAVPKRQAPLKGGRDKPSGGEEIGLNW